MFGDGTTDAEKKALRVAEIDAEIASEQSKIDRSNAGQTVSSYRLQGAEMGRRGSQTRIDQLEAEREGLAGRRLQAGEVATGINSRANALRELEAERRGRRSSPMSPIERNRERRVMDLTARFDRRASADDFRDRGAAVQRQGPPGQSGPVAPVTQVNMQNIDNSDKSSSQTVQSSPIVDQNPMVRAALGAY